jgi:hypothetical protein
MAATEEKVKVASAPGGGAMMVAGDAAPPNVEKGSTRGTRVIESLAFSPDLCFPRRTHVSSIGRTLLSVGRRGGRRWCE